MQTFNIHEAKTNLSRLVEEAAKGNAFIIAKAGKPMVKVCPYPRESAKVLKSWDLWPVRFRRRMILILLEPRKS